MTKAQRLAEVRLRVNRQLLGVPIMGEDDAFFRELIKGHPEFPAKFSPGIKHFILRKNPHYPNHTLYVVLTNGLEDGVSWQACVTGYAAAHGLIVKKAFRDAIEQQVKPLRRPGQDVHHVRTFDVLFDLFWVSRCEPPFVTEDVEVKEDIHGRCALADLKLLRDWLTFHEREAQLEVMPRAQHKQLKRKK
jgi:hypothetical protein